MYFNVNFKLFQVEYIVHLLVSEVYRISIIANRSQKLLQVQV